ncbi:MAG: hypothetical protein ABJC89_24900, partial [Acidobacteriota bacterium]
MNYRTPSRLVQAGLSLAVAAGVFHVTARAQDRLKSMPGYEQYQKMSREIPSAIKPGTVSGGWKDARTLEYAKEGKIYRYSVTTNAATPAGAAAFESGGRGPRAFSGGPERGRQMDSAES